MYQGPCDHPDEADIEITFDDFCYVKVCEECEKSNYDNCPEHPESYRELPSYQNN